MLFDWVVKLNKDWDFGRIGYKGLLPIPKETLGYGTTNRQMGPPEPFSQLHIRFIIDLSAAVEKSHAGKQEASRKQETQAQMPLNGSHTWSLCVSRNTSKLNITCLELLYLESPCAAWEMCNARLIPIQIKTWEGSPEGNGETRSQEAGQNVSFSFFLFLSFSSHLSFLVVLQN